MILFARLSLIRNLQTWLLWEGTHISKRKITLKLRNNSFRQTQFGRKASELTSPVRIWGYWRSPYAYGDSMTLIPVCIWGFVRCLYAYGDISVTNRMHNEIVSIWEIKSCIPICKIMHMGIAVRIWESPYAYGQGSLNYSHMGIPVRITKLCAYWEQHIRHVVWGIPTWNIHHLTD